MTLRLLVSFAHMGKDPLASYEGLKGQDVIIDSGAFTAHRTGREIELGRYIEFIKGAKLKPWTYFNLDVIGDAKASRKNYALMLKAGVNPIPVVTVGDGPQDFKEYAKTAERGAIGGLVRAANKHARVAEIMEVVEGTKVHWLGYANLDMIKRYRPNSVDVTTWANPSIYKVTAVISPVNGKITQLPIKKFRQRPKLEMIQRIRALGIEPQALAKELAWKDGGAAHDLCARSFVSFAHEVEERLGTKVFFASMPTRKAWGVLAKAEEYLA